MGRVMPVAFADAPGKPQFSPRLLIFLRAFSSCGLIVAEGVGVPDCMLTCGDPPCDPELPLDEPAEPPLVPDEPLAPDCPDVDPCDDAPPGDPPAYEFPPPVC